MLSGFFLVCFAWDGPYDVKFFFVLLALFGMTRLLIHYHYKIFSSPEGMLEMHIG